MAYGDDIAALGADHHWSFDGNSNDNIGASNGTNSGVIFTRPAIAKDATNCMSSNGTVDRVTLPTTADINNSTQTRKIISGFFSTDDIQPPPKRIYGEGNQSITFQFVMAFGNNVMFEVVDATYTQQIYGPVMQPGRVYHLCAAIEDGTARFWVDGVEMTLAEPSDRLLGTNNLSARSVGIFADPSGTVGVGGDVILLNAPAIGDYQHWNAFDGTILTTSQVREELFEKGALPDVTIASGTEAAIQTSIDALANTTRPDAPISIEIGAVTGDGDLSVSLDNITFDLLASVHIQYLGTGTLTIVNQNGSNASIGSTPNGGTIVFTEFVTVSITALDATTFNPIENARLILSAGATGALTQGDLVLTGVTNASGVISTTGFEYSTDQSVEGWLRKGSSPFYKQANISEIITENGMISTVLMVSDE